MREANELEKNNCITTITQLNYTEKCVPLYPGNDVINGIGEATDTLNDARQSKEEFLLLKKLDLQAFINIRDRIRTRFVVLFYER